MRTLGAETGRVGCIVPSGIATDNTTRYFFQDLVERGSLTSLFEFENEGFFPAAGQGHMNRFCLLVLNGPSVPSPSTTFLFQGKKVSDLSDSNRTFTLSSDDFILLNPNTRTCPIFRTRLDAEITKGVYGRIPALVDKAKRELGNPWGIEFSTMFHMTNDSELFLTRQGLEAEGSTLRGNLFYNARQTYLPLYESKMVHQFDHRYGDHALLAAGQGGHVLPEVPDSLRQNPRYSPLPRYWVPSLQVTRRLPKNHRDRGWLLGWRNVADARASARTVIASVTPLVGVGNSLPLLYCHRTAPEAASLLANLNSFVLDYVARQKVGGLNINFFIVEQFAILTPETFEREAPWSPGEALSSWIAKRVLELVYTAWDLAPFAHDLGWDGAPLRWDSERRTILRAELDAAFFHLYGLGRDEVDYVMETFLIVRNRDLRAHGEYRTKRLVLECFDAMAKASSSGEPYRTVLVPPADPTVAHIPQS